MTPVKAKPAPERIEQIVKAVLERNALRGIQLAIDSEAIDRIPEART